MGSLPRERVIETRPFTDVGVDYCRPFFVKERQHRNRGRIKVYVAVFVCFTTRAVNLELGAANELRELRNLLRSDDHRERVVTFLAKRAINWHFIPPQAPHFGGAELFTFENLNTLIINIEAILNSRPLTPISSDPTDLLALTPGHFLIGDALTSLHERDLEDTNPNRLSVWQRIQQLKQQFWKHNVPSMQWPLGRVLKIHPRSDGIIRAVTVKTAANVFDRSVKKLVPIFHQPEEHRRNENTTSINNQ
ncbi:uncharacterized protein LOC143259840 [Megalopta genalis]|uniref:uncharacterized protein LOC143259840 n=1 Tax=Megalopta genalis TaxID=115081 RepID=UPI003FD477B1